MIGDIEDLARVAVDAGFHIHRDLGPGLLESVYEAVLASELERRGLKVDRQKPVGIVYRGVTLQEGFRVDMLIDDKLLIELKSVEKLQPVHGKQVLTYLRPLDLPLGLLMNFGGGTFKEGIKRIANNHNNFAP